MKTNLRIILILIVIIIFVGAWFIWDSLKKEATKRCGDVVLTGYLVPNCIWQAYPSLPDSKSTLHPATLCNLDIWLSGNEPESNNPEVCGENPLTSKCFLENVSSFDPWGDPWGAIWKVYRHQKVTLIGKYEKIKVCHIGYKAIPPPVKCEEESVFVPCEMIEE